MWHQREMLLKSYFILYELQVDAVDIVNNQKMREYAARYERELEGVRNQLDSTQQQKDDLVVQLQVHV